MVCVTIKIVFCLNIYIGKPRSLYSHRKKTHLRRFASRSLNSGLSVEADLQRRIRQRVRADIRNRIGPK